VPFISRNPHKRSFVEGMHEANESGINFFPEAEEPLANDIDSFRIRLDPSILFDIKGDLLQILHM